MIKKISLFSDMIRMLVSAKFASKIASDYWSNTTKTHGSMDESNFDFYYNGIKKVADFKKDDAILDYGGGNGEIAYRFQKDDFKHISHCDISPEMVENAKRKFQLDSFLCNDLPEKKYDKILINNAIFYIHPSLLEAFITNISNYLSENGQLLLTDSPDYEKRSFLYSDKLTLLITKFIPVYQPTLAGFFIKTKKIQSIANKLGMSMERTDSWAKYRSHWVLSK